MFITNAYAQTTAPSTAPAGGPESFLAGPLPFFVLMVAMVYFMMIRPQMKRQKELKALMDALSKGDEVITAGGLLGKVVKVSEAYVTLEIADGAEAVFQKSAITTLLPKGTIKSL